MNSLRGLMAVFVVSTIVTGSATTADDDQDEQGWSKPAAGLQVKLTLIEKSKINGTRSLVPYLELRNASDSAHPFKVRCGEGHIQFELVDANGKTVRDGWILPRSGPHADPGIVALPHDSSMRISMYCSNWGVPKDAAAMISTDSGAWVLKPEEKGKVFLRCTIKGAEDKSDADRIWHGTLATPDLKVDWNK